MENQSNEIKTVDLATFIETQSKLNNVMNKFMIETTKSLANSEESNASLLSELKRLREEKTRVEPPPKKQRSVEDGDISMTLDDEDELLQEEDEESVHSGLAQNDDPEELSWAARSGSGDRSAEEDDGEIDEGILRSRYKNLYQQVEEVGGDPISQDLSKVVKETWGRTIL